jgi:hypothetical protein
MHCTITPYFYKILSRIGGTRDENNGFYVRFEVLDRMIEFIGTSVTGFLNYT